MTKFVLLAILLGLAGGGCKSTPSAPPATVECPPTDADRDGGHAKPIGDVDGDGRTDHEYPTHPVSTGPCRLVCLSQDGSPTFYVICDRKFVGRCPFGHGENRWEWRDGRFRGSSTDGGADDDRDGKKDSIEYEYDPSTGKLTIVVREDGENVTKDGAYVIDAPSSPAGLPTPHDVPHGP